MFFIVARVKWISSKKKMSVWKLLQSGVNAGKDQEGNYQEEDRAVNGSRSMF